MCFLWVVFCAIKNEMCYPTDIEYLNYAIIHLELTHHLPVNPHHKEKSAAEFHEAQHSNVSWSLST